MSLSASQSVINVDSVINLTEKIAQRLSVEPDRRIPIATPILKEAVYKTNDYLHHYFVEPCTGPSITPNVFKQAGALCFNIRKLKPAWSFKIAEPNTLDSFDLLINETIAFEVGLEFIAEDYDAKGLWEPFVKHVAAIFLKKNFMSELHSNLCFGSFSPTSITFIYRALFELPEWSKK